MKSAAKKHSAFPKKQKNVVVIGVCGAAGSFSEEAAKIYVQKQNIQNADFRYLVTAEAVFSALSKREVTIAVVPVANSIGGIVRESLLAGAKYTYVVQEVFSIQIHQNILVKKGTTPGAIKQIVSHEQAIKQCRGYLKRVWPKVKVGEYPDTAKAAKDLAEGELPASTGVIASRAAAKLYKLDILGASIQDDKHNVTTFIAAMAA